MVEESRSLEYTPTWVVAGVCSVIVIISLCAERALHRLGKCLKHKKQDALFEALQKLKEELMLLGFISLLLTVFQGVVSHICMPKHFESHMLPCKRDNSSEINSHHEQYSHQAIKNGRRLLSATAGSDICAHKGKVPLLSIEALHHLHIFIFVLAVVHMVFCATTMVLGGAKIRRWKNWEDSIRSGTKQENGSSRVINTDHMHASHHTQFLKEHTIGYWRKSAVIGWLISFFKQFYGSVTKSDYITLRRGFIMAHCPSMPTFDFHEYMMRTLEIDFKKVVGISWYLWLFVVLFLLMNIAGWHTYFWLAFLPLILLLLVGAKLEHVITRLAEGDVVGERKTGVDHEAARVKPSDDHFWFNRPTIVLYLIHFILFQNSFEIAFFFWIWSTYGFTSCIMEKVGYIVPRLIMGVIVQVLCSYSTLPLYAIVTQMGSMFKEGMFKEHVRRSIDDWLHARPKSGSSHTRETDHMDRMASNESFQNDQIAQQRTLAGIEGTTTSTTELSCPGLPQIHMPPFP